MNTIDRVMLKASDVLQANQTTSYYRRLVDEIGDDTNGFEDILQAHQAAEEVEHRLFAQYLDLLQEYALERFGGWEPDPRPPTPPKKEE